MTVGFFVGTTAGAVLGMLAAPSVAAWLIDKADEKLRRREDRRAAAKSEPVEPLRGRTDGRGGVFDGAYVVPARKLEKLIPLNYE